MTMHVTAETVPGSGVVTLIVRGEGIEVRPSVKPSDARELGTLLRVLADAAQADIHRRSAREIAAEAAATIDACDDLPPE